MIIECKTCHARFRLDESKIKGKGARVKCRKCGEQIIVMKEADSAALPRESEEEGSLDLGSALREPSGEDRPAPGKTPPDNLIPFPGPAADAGEPAGKDEVDIAFEQMLSRSPEPPEEPAVAAGEAPSEPMSEAPPAPSFEVPPEPTFEAPPAPSFEAPPELKFETPPEPTFEVSQEPAFEAPPEPKFDLPQELTFETPAPSAAGEPVVPSFEPPAAPAFEEPAVPMFEPSPEPAGEGPAPEAPAAEMPMWTAGEGALEAAAEGKPGPPPPPEEERPPEIGAGADISLSIAPSPVDLEPGLPLEMTGFPAGKEEPIAPPPEGIVVEGNVTPPAGSPEPEIPPPGEEEPEPAQPAVAAQPPEPPRGPAERQAPARPGLSPVLVLGVAALFLLAAVGYFAFTGSGKRLLGKAAPGIAALLGGGDAGKAGSMYEVKNVIGYYDSGAASPRILVIKGQVTNLSSTGKSGIRVLTSLLDNTGRVLTEQTVFAGNTIPGERLKKDTRTALEKTLANPLGEHLANMDVPPGKTIPFMVLFFDAPGDIDSYRIEAKDTQ
jgi:predicted Zn finger-like uncharacterized protein